MFLRSSFASFLASANIEFTWLSSVRGLTNETNHLNPKSINCFISLALLFGSCLSSPLLYQSVQNGKLRSFLNDTDWPLSNNWDFDLGTTIGSSTA
ncbi:hypothetical protein V6Z12_D11G390700 [Gossypium hirsutum]